MVWQGNVDKYRYFLIFEIHFLMLKCIFKYLKLKIKFLYQKTNFECEKMNLNIRKSILNTKKNEFWILENEFQIRIYQRFSNILKFILQYLKIINIIFEFHYQIVVIHFHTYSLRKKFFRSQDQRAGNRHILEARKKLHKPELFFCQSMGGLEILIWLICQRRLLQWHPFVSLIKRICISAPVYF